ncbi:alcohol dehydrogenase catalytic domain-containing protein [Kytococcus sedentarius]|uniref:alcohol dehydrogenase catalytic domain-containing protein n=1 Tax=Kytococcus sedentarius TaxID=1276 RepID=UPI0035BBDB23
MSTHPDPLRTTGAVLHTLQAAAPYADSAPMRVQELELDPPGEREVLVRIEAASVCHSDLSVVQGRRPRPVPMLLGHESAGVVEEIGSGVTTVEVGDRVVMTFLPRCGECEACATQGRLPCTLGSQANERGDLLSGGRRLHAQGESVAHHLGVSGFATRAVVDERSVVPVDADVPADVAAVLGCAVLTGGGAVVNVVDLPAPTGVVVVGLGGVGMAAVLVAGALGHEVVGVDGVASKRELALELGASRTFAPQEAEEQELRGALVVDATGNPRGFETAVALTGPGGTTVTVGLPPADAESTLRPLGLVAQARTITGSYLGSAVPQRDIPRFVDLWRQGRLPVERLISSHIGLEDINLAMDRLEAGEELRQVIVLDDRPGEAPSP